MVDQEQGKKHVIVHIGPHKTGSTALQQCLEANRGILAQASILFLHDGVTHDAALQLAREDFEAAKERLRTIAEIISRAREEIVILSQEDFCGDLPGRSRRKAIYPKLTKNLRIIARTLQPHHVRFVFYERAEEGWLVSCYHQHLKHRTLFSSFEGFRNHFDEALSWRQKLDKPKETFGDSLIMLPYSKVPEAGVRAILGVAGQPHLNLSPPPSERNSSPEPEKLRLLERINALSGFRPTAWFAKSLVMQDWQPRVSQNPSKPVFSVASDMADLALPALTKRALSRISPQEVDDILPPKDVDLSNYVFDTLPADVELPTASRADINDQSLILDYHFRGKSRLAKLNALTISYLRRDTRHTDKARHLFHRIWREHGPLLVNELTTRWLISTLQTFLDHGENEAQRMIGASGYFYANMMKIYEGERAIEGRAQDATYEQETPQTANKFNGLDRYSVGGTDLLLNTNALAHDMAMRDDVAGLVLFELLLRVRASANVFTRMDRTRKEKGIAVPGFTDTWSFFEP
ncbi:MAG: hypothetical protein ACK5M4_07480 [Pseudorhodobacter sp.]